MTARDDSAAPARQPGAGRTAVVGRHGDAWKVRVAEAPERGRANEAVLRLLAETLALPRTALTLVSGHGAREKIVELTGIGPALIERRLASAAGGATEAERRGGDARSTPSTSATRLLDERGSGSSARSRRCATSIPARSTTRSKRSTTARQPPRRDRLRTLGREIDYTLGENCRAGARRDRRGAGSGSRTARTGRARTAARRSRVERLEAHPWASLCIDCKRKAERG